MPLLPPSFSPQRPLFYVHIPKVGGMSLEALLDDCFPAGAARRIEHHPDRAPSLQDPMPLLSCYFGHVSYRFRDLLPHDTTVFTFLRDPIDRALSVFYYWQSLGRDHLICSGIPQDALPCVGLTIDEFVSRMPRQARAVLGNVQTSYLGSDRPYVGSSPYNDTQSTADFDRAMKALDEMAFVGLTERMDESVASLCRLFGWFAPTSAPHVNQTPKRPASSKLDSRTRGILEEWTALDAALVSEARARYDEQLRRLPTWPAPEPASQVEFTGAGPMAGWGWHRRQQGSHGWYRWTTQRAGLPLAVRPGPVQVTLDVLATIDPAQFEGLQLLLDDRPLESRRSSLRGGAMRYTATGEITLPSSRLEIVVPQAIRPCDRDPGSTDTRVLGVAVSRLSVRSTGSGWLSWPWAS